jgi:hypothetical protein
MADPQVIEKTLRLYLQAIGSSDIEKIMGNMKKSTVGVQDEINRLTDVYGNVEDAVKVVADKYLRMTRIGRTGIKAQSTAVKGLNKDLNQVGSSIKNAVLWIKRLALPAGFLKTVNVADDYNKALLTSSARMTRFGVGIRETESRIISLSKNLSFTRRETLSLFKSYEQGFKFVSLGNFEKHLGNIRKAVGANAEETQNLLGIIGGLSQRYAGLTRLMTSASQADKNKASEQAKGLLLAQKISDTEYRGIQTYLNARKQLTPQDKLREQTVQNQIKAMQDLKKTVEEIGIAFGQTILPVLKDISGIIKNLDIDFSGVAKTVVTIAGALTAIKIGSLANRTGSGFLSVGAAAKIGALDKSSTPPLAKGKGIRRLLGGAAATGASGGGFGGIVGRSSIVQQVHVVNWPFSLRDRGTGRQGQGLIAGQRKREAQVIKSERMSERMEAREGKKSWWRRNTDRNKLRMEDTKTMGRGVGAIAGRGLMGGMKFLSSPGGILASLVGNLGLGYLGGKAEESGNRMGMGAARAGQGLAGVAGTAGSMAMFGSFFGPIGTAVGAVIGGVGGVISQWDTIFQGVKDIFTGGTTDEFKKLQKDKKRDAEIEANVRKRVADPEKKPATVEAILEQTINLSGEDLINKIKELSTSTKDIEELEQVAKDATVEFEKMLDSLIEAPVGVKATTVGLKELTDEIANEQKVLEGMTAAGSSTDALNEQEKVIAAKEKEKKEVMQIRADTVLYSKELQQLQNTLVENNNKLDEAKSGNEGVLQFAYKHLHVVKSLNDLYSKQVGYLDAVVGRMKITGEVDAGKLLSDIENTVKMVDEEVRQRQIVLDILTTIQSTGKQLTNQEVEQLGLTGNNLALAKKVNQANLQELDIAGMLTEQQTAQTNSLEEQKKAVFQVSEAYQGRISAARAEASVMEKMVNLADNFAIGVGASAQMRMMSFQKEEKVIQGLTKQYDAQLAIIQRTSDFEELAAARQKMAEIEGEILDSQIKQASQVKALRDGWISAIGAMNTGAGTFSKIIISQEQAVAQSLKMGGVVSSKSGAFSRFGPRGLEEEAGYRQSARFSATLGGGIGFNRQTGGQGNFAYRTTTGADRSLEDSMVNTVKDMVQRKVGGAGGGTFQPTLAMTGHRFVESAALGQFSTTGNPYQEPKGIGGVKRGSRGKNVLSEKMEFEGFNTGMRAVTGPETSVLPILAEKDAGLMGDKIKEELEAIRGSKFGSETERAKPEFDAEVFVEGMEVKGMHVDEIVLNKPMKGEGKVQGYAEGGFVPQGTDTIPAMLTPGELIIPEEQAKFVKRILDYLSMPNVKYFAEGGSVGNMLGISYKSPELSTVDREIKEAQIRGTNAMIDLSTKTISTLQKEQSGIARSLSILFDIPKGDARHLGGGAFSPIDDEEKRLYARAAYFKTTGESSDQFEDLKGKELDNKIDEIIISFEKLEEENKTKISNEKKNITEWQKTQQEAQSAIVKDFSLGFDFGILVQNAKKLSESFAQNVIAQKTAGVPVDEIRKQEGYAKYRNITEDIKKLQSKIRGTDDIKEQQELRREVESKREERNDLGIRGRLAEKARSRRSREKFEELQEIYTPEQIALAKNPTAQTYMENFGIPSMARLPEARLVTEGPGLPPHMLGPVPYEPPLTMGTGQGAFSAVVNLNGLNISNDISESVQGKVKGQLVSFADQNARTIGKATEGLAKALANGTA